MNEIRTAIVLAYMAFLKEHHVTDESTATLARSAFLRGIMHAGNPDVAAVAKALLRDFGAA